MSRYAPPTQVRRVLSRWKSFVRCAKQVLRDLHEIFLLLALLMLLLLGLAFALEQATEHLRSSAKAESCYSAIRSQDRHEPSALESDT